MNVLSICDGMSCGRIALGRAGIKVENYYASEIDKYAIQVTQANYPDTIQLGDMTAWREWDIDWKSIGMVQSGTPCQGFSFAGKQLAFDDPRSKLFFVFVDILRHVQSFNPSVLFLLENVRMKEEHELVISRTLGINPIAINSSLLSAQSRYRNYWTNIGCEPRGLFGDMECVIPQPKDKGILLRDVLETEVDEKYYLKTPLAGFSGMDLNSKSNTLRIGGGATQSNKHNFDLIKIDKKGTVKSNQDKASTFTAGGHSGGNHSDMDLIIVASRGRNPENPSDRTTGANLEQRLEPRTDGKTNTLTSVQKDNMVLQLNPSKESNGQQPYQQNRVYSPDGISPALNTDGRTHAVKVKALNENQQKKFNPNINADKANTLTLAQGRAGSSEEYMDAVSKIAKLTSRIRRLTPLECMRLQTVNDNYKMPVSDSQKYKMLGNGWTIDVIAHILKYAF